MTRTIRRGSLAMAALLCAQPVLAGDGPLQTAQGTKALGMAGTSLAFSHDALAAANNPAGMAFVGHRLDMGVQFVSIRADGAFGAWADDGSAFVPVPEIGYNRPLNDQWSIGVSTLTGGAGFNYDAQFMTGTGSPTRALYLTNTILPTVTYRPTPDLALGASLALAVQGLDIRNMPGLPNQGMKWSYGIGLRLGALWQASEKVSLGAVYASNISMQSLSGYRDTMLAAGDGSLDIPEQYGLGVKVELTPDLTVGVDYMHINWSDTEWATHFGYRDQDVLRIGAEYAASETWTLRAGARTARRQFGTDSVAQNLPLPGINTDAVSIGATKILANGGELSLGLEYDFGSPARGTGPSAGAEIDTEFMIASVSYALKF